MKKTNTTINCLTPIAIAIASAFTSAAWAQEPTAEQEVEKIEVTGIRASVTKALALKRTEVGVSDAISADDIASFPDENIAESIQRIPGIQIQRSNGRGALISIRGMGPEYAATTLNGQSFASAQFNGGFRYDIVQSELASEIQVFKTPSASQEEGGLSGTVNIGTAKPLSFDERKLLFKAEGIYSGDRESTTPGAGFTYIDQSDDGKLGWLFNGGYQELDTRYDLMFSQRFSDVDANMDGESDYAGGIPVEMTDRPRLRREDGNTQRYLFSGAVQYLATNDLELNFTSVVALDNRDVFFQQLVPLFSGGNPSPELTFLGQTGNTIDHILAENARIEANHTWQTEERTSYALTGDFDWNASDNLLVKGALHYTAGQFDMYERLRVLGIRSDLEVDMDPINPQLISQGLNPLDDPNSWAPSNLFRNDLQGRVDVFSTDELAVQLDLEYRFDGDFLQSFKAGVKQRNQTLETSSRRYNANFRTEEEILNAPFDTVAESHIVVDNFSGGEFPGLSLDYVLPNILEAVASYGEPKDTMPEDLLEASFFEIDRNITTVYGQLDFSTGDLRGNVGVRYAYTDRTVDTLNYDNGITISDGALENIGGDSGTPTSNSYDYNNWLPSINLAYDLTDEVVLRASAGKALVRPVIGQTANFSRAISATNDGTNTIVSVNEGSYDLPALTANQFDLSAEWYFNESGALTLAYFKKDIKNQVRSETVCPTDFDLATVAFNAANNACMGDDGYIYNISRNRVTDGVLEINGFELAYNQSFDFLPAPFDGLGLIANYTILDAKNPDEQQPLLGSSEKTYNLVTYYEKDGFSVRVALNHRSEYALNDGFIYGRNYGPSSNLFANPGATLEARNQIDISVGYEIDDSWKVSFEGININGDYELGTRFEAARLQSIATFGSTYFVKLRYSL